MSNNNLSNGIRTSSSSPMVAANGNHHTISHNVSHPMNNGNHSIRNAFSHNPLNLLERYFDLIKKEILLFFFVQRNQSRPSSRANGVLKSVSKFFP